MKFRSYILSIGKYVNIVLVILLLLSILCMGASFVVMFFTLMGGLKMFGISVLASAIAVALIIQFRRVLDWAIETCEGMLFAEINRLHKEMDTIIEQFKKDKGE